MCMLSPAFPVAHLQQDPAAACYAGKLATKVLPSVLRAKQSPVHSQTLLRDDAALYCLLGLVQPAGVHQHASFTSACKHHDITVELSTCRGKSLLSRAVCNELRL